jgi:MSHA biogenesis protein MshQ
MRRANHWLSALGLIALTAFAQSALARTCTAKTGSVNWSNNNSWSNCGGNTPQSGDTVIIPNGSTVTLTQNINAIASLTINAGGIINDKGFNVNVNGSITVNGTFGVAGGGGSLIANGTNVTISGTGTFANTTLQINNSATIATGSTLNFSAGGMIDVGPNAPPPNTVTLNIAGAITGTGQTAGNTILNGNGFSSINITGSINAPASDITLVAGDVLTNNGTVTVQTLTTDPSTLWTQGANSSLTLGSTAGFQGTLNASASGNTVTYPNGMAPIIPLSNTYFNLVGPTCAQVQAAGLIILGTGPCGVTPQYLQYHMDEALWAGIPGEVTDSSGNGLNGTAVNGATTANTTPALTGNPGTCGYGVFDGNTNYVALPNAFPNLTTNFTFTAWIRTTNNAKGGQRILIDDQNNTGGYGLSLGDGGTGMLRFYARGSAQIILDTANVIGNNTWYFVAAVADISNAKRYIYVYDATGVFVTSVSVTSSGWGIDTGAASIGGENNSSAETGPTFHFAGNIDEVQVFNSALTQAALNTLAVQTHPCTGGGGGTASSFSAIDEAYPAAPTIPAYTDFSTGHIFMKLATTPFKLWVAALTSNGISTAYSTAQAKYVEVKLIDNSGTVCGADSARTCNSTCTNSAAAEVGGRQIATFAKGGPGASLSPSFTLNSSWNNLVAVMKECTDISCASFTTTTACSVDSFSVRPISFASVTSTAATNTGTSGTPIFKAVSGQFDLAATTAGGYTGAPKINSASVQPASPATQPGALAGIFSAAISGTPSSTATGTTFSYSEVGAFYLQAPDFTVPRIPGVYDDTWTATDSDPLKNDCITGTTAAAYSNIKDTSGKYGCNFGITANTTAFGRFVPDHFDTTVDLSAGLPMPCPTGLICPALFNGFVYSGQSFTANVYARNASGNLTLNYDGTMGLSKQVTLSVWNALGGTTAITNGTLNNNTVAASAFRSGATSPLGTSASPNFTFTVAATPPTDIYIRAVDADSITSSRGVSSVEGGVKVASGRIKVSNAYGSELLPLTLLATAQYYTGTGWLNSTTDSVTKLASINASYPVGLGTSTVTLNPVSKILYLGNLTINLSAPSATGIVTVTPTIDPASPGNPPFAFGSGTIIPGTATFGVYKSKNNYIYRRESY